MTDFIRNNFEVGIKNISDTRIDSSMLELIKEIIR